MDSPRGQTELYSVEDALRGQFEVMFSHPVVDGHLCSNRCRDRISRVSNSGCRAAGFCSRLTYEDELRRANPGRHSVILESQCDWGMHILSLNRIPGVNLSCLAVGIVAFFNVGIAAFSVCCLTSCL